MTDIPSPDASPCPEDLIRAAVAAGLEGAPTRSNEAPAGPKEGRVAAPPETVMASASDRTATPPPATPIEAAGFGEGLARMRHLAEGVSARLAPLGAPRFRRTAAAAGMALTAALGFGVALLTHQPGGSDDAAQHWAEAATGLKQTGGEVAKISAELKAVRAAVETLRGERDRLRGDLAAKQAQLNEKLEKATAESAARALRFAEQLDRIEKVQRDPARLAGMVERLDRIEKQTSTVAERVAAPTPPPKPAAISAATADSVTQTGSLAEAKPAAKAAEFDPRKTHLDTHVLRDIDDGVALLENRAGRMIEVHAGQIVAGLGKIEAIERRGRGWIVVTSKGYVADRLP